MNELAIKDDATELKKVLDTLVQMSKDDPYDPFREMVWPETLEPGQYWMSPGLMSVQGTELEKTLPEEQLTALSQWEFINFCSLNVTGIRELLVEMTGRLHTPGFELISEYLHYLIAEENEHMWYFSRFCLDYGKKIYPDRAMSMGSFAEEDIANLIIFSRILIFEEIVDFYNRKMGKDQSLPQFVRKINWLHHLDEGRHIKYGRLYIELFYRQLKEKYSRERLQAIEETIKGFMRLSVQKLYRPEMYRDAGLENPGFVRKQLLADPARMAFNDKLVAGTARFFTKIGVFSSADVWQKPATALS